MTEKAQIPFARAFGARVMYVCVARSIYNGPRQNRAITSQYWGGQALRNNSESGSRNPIVTRNIFCATSVIENVGREVKILSFHVVVFDFTILVKNGRYQSKLRSSCGFYGINPTTDKSQHTWDIGILPCWCSSPSSGGLHTYRTRKRIEILCTPSTRAQRICVSSKGSFTYFSYLRVTREGG